MIRFLKLPFGLFAGLLSFQNFSHADQVYELPKTANRFSVAAFSTTLDARDIVDSIPELGIVVMRETASALKAESAGLKPLGKVGTVSLIAPKAAPTSTLWGLKAIRLSEAWQSSKGAGVVVAVSDTGVDATHADLKNQMWKNPGETGLDSKGRNKATNKIDDDRNGQVDDVHGWDFVKNKNGGVDHHFHGTHVAGTIAAQASTSVVGVAPSAKIMDVSFLNAEGQGSDTNGAKSIVYAVKNGAKVINCSWGGTGGNRTLEKAIAYAQERGVLVIAAAGNDGTDNDKKRFAPSGYSNPNIVAIGATSDSVGTKAYFSNYGKKSVDLAAPGEGIRSLSPGNGYQSLSGTSMASPHVAGVAALVWSAHPNYTFTQVKKALMSTRSAPAWSGISITEGILDAQLAVTH